MLKFLNYSWFMESVLGEESSQEVLVTLKQRASFHYRSKNYAKAAEAYGKCLELVPSSNNTWKREFLENLARSFLKLGDPEKALEWSLKLDESSINEDQKVISMNLLASVCHKLGKYKEELEALHSCMHAHKVCPEYWLRLGLCYAGLFKINLPGFSLTRAEDEESESEMCCAFNSKQYKLPSTHLPKLVSTSESANSSPNKQLDENSSPAILEDDTVKCDFCSLGIQIVSSCLIRTKTLIDSGGLNLLGGEKDVTIKEKIDNCLRYMEVDQSFIDIASKMLGTDFFALTEVCDSTLDSQNTFAVKQNGTGTLE
ncbi:zinc fingers and homeoboxes protein 1 isoform X6 [Parasteatoda tepidariorum]|uniref:zinc fingers and homeoboxes protein 1 isoform X6 n=1 Tax=Parasteatoda tepidariorum TaxID=114398 RepID=UPI0039BC8A9B